MRPSVSIVGDELIDKILAEAKRILAEVGVEVSVREVLWHQE